MHREQYALPPGKYRLTLEHTAPDGTASRLTLPALFSGDTQWLNIEEDHADIIDGDHNRVARVVDSRSVSLDFDADVQTGQDGVYIIVESPIPQWRVTFTHHGLMSWIDFHCEADARRFASEGYELGMFIQPEVTKKEQQ